MIILVFNHLPALAQAPFVHVVGTGGYEEEARALALLPDGTFYTAGQRFSLNAFKSEGVVSKFNADGTAAWSRAIASQADVFLFGVVTLANGNVMAVGHDEFQGLRPMVATFTPNGLPQFEQRLDFLTGYEAAGLCTFDGNSVYALVVNPVTNAAKIIKFNSQADTLWTQNVTDTQTDLKAKGIGSASNGGAVVCGSANGDNDGFALHVNPDGSTEWLRFYNVGEFEQLYGISASPSGGYWATGVATGASGTAGGTDLSVLNIDANGDLISERIFGSAFNDLGFGIASLADGGAMLTGAAYRPGQSAYRDLFLARVDAQGDSLWTRFVHAGSGADVGYAVSTDASGAVAVGKTDALNDTEDALVVRIGLNGNLTSVPTIEQNTGLRVYPNPASTNIQFTVGHNFKFPATVKILDLNGKELLRAKATSNNIPLLTDLATGLYVLVVEGAGNALIQLDGR